MIVLKKTDGSVALVHPNPLKYGDGKTPFSECKGLNSALAKHTGSTWFEYSGNFVLSDAETLTQVYCDDSNNLIIDTSWERQIMPCHCIKKRYLASLDAIIDAELAKPTPDPIVVISNQREKEKWAKETDEKKWAQKALERLDARVANGESDKPVIRQKLQEKLAQ